jgi:alcohol dehydrogenase class IV
MWFFNSPQVVFGEDALTWLSQLKGQRAMIVTDPIVEKLGFVDRVKEQLITAGMNCEVFAEIEPDPCLQTIKECALKMESINPDWVIGLGGGSCMDAAKAAWFLYERPDVPLEAINPMEVFNLRAKARLITIPTTSGTGSDVSWGFALANPDEKCKLVRVTRELVPDIALVDPAFTTALPQPLTAETGLDVLAHAIEGFTCLWHNDFTDGLCIKAIQLVFKYLPRAFSDGSDLEAREHMHNAATIAGLGFSNTAIILAHAMAHALGGYFHTPHGRTVGMFLPYTIEFIAKKDPERYSEIARELNLAAYDELQAVASLVAEIRKLQEFLKQPISIKEMGITLEELDQALPHLVLNISSAVELVATPRIPTNEEVNKLIHYAYEGRNIDF